MVQNLRHGTADVEQHVLLAIRRQHTQFLHQRLTIAEAGGKVLPNEVLRQAPHGLQDRRQVPQYGMEFLAFCTFGDSEALDYTGKERGEGGK